MHVEQKDVLSGGWGGAPETKNVNISLYVEQNTFWEGDWLGDWRGSLESNNVNISLHVEQNNVLRGGWGGAPESKHVDISLYGEQNSVLGGGWLGGAGEGLRRAKMFISNYT